MTGTEIVAFREGAVMVASALQAVVSTARQNRVVSRGQLEELRLHCDRALALSRMGAVAELSRESIRQIASTTREIESLRLAGAAERYAYEQLDQQHRMLRRIIDGFLV